MKTTLCTVAAAVLLLQSPLVAAGVSAAEAARLNTELTPLGGERAGNKDGSIPAWTGGFTDKLPGWSPGQRRPDPFKEEKPLYSITAKNMEQYASALSEGQQALLKRYPDTYRLDVYKTHRTAVAPQRVYEATAKNAVNGKMDNGAPTGVSAGIPFPIPRSGEEVIFNHLLRWRGEATRLKQHSVQVTPEGTYVMVQAGTTTLDHPYYTRPTSHNGDFWWVRLVTTGPALRAGEQLVDRHNVVGEKSQAWIYLTGQRRVRKLPLSCCDTPSPATAGLMTVDEIGVWAGRLDRFDWKIIGKKEMYIPYNTNRTLVPKRDIDIATPKHLNPDHVRWELHRVWEVEATLRAGQRHFTPKSRYYVDEDSWLAVLADRWDSKGLLWRTLYGLPIIAPDVPGVLISTFGLSDLIGGGYVLGGVGNEADDAIAMIVPPSESMFTPEAMMGEGVR